MTLRRVGVWGILFLLPSSVLNADTLVIRDSIGADTSLTDGMPGGTYHSRWLGLEYSWASCKCAGGW